SSDSSRASGGSFGTSSVSSSAMRLPCASPQLKVTGARDEEHGGSQRPPRRRPFMNRRAASQPRAASAIGTRRQSRYASPMTRAVAVIALLLTAAAGPPHKVVRNTPALDFDYEWP